MDINALMALAQDNWELVAGGGSAVVALLSALIAARETGKQRRLQQEDLRARIDAASLDWGSEAIDLLSHACMLVTSNHLTEHEFETRRVDYTARLSALIDRGRMFFPNLMDDGMHGATKASAYRGKRPPILDTLIYAYHELRLAKPGHDQGAADFLVECRRLLVSELQTHLDPARMDEVVERYDDQANRWRQEALDQAGRLGIIFDLRRPGLLAAHNDKGWTGRISPEDRRDLRSRYGDEGERTHG